MMNHKNLKYLTALTVIKKIKNPELCLILNDYESLEELFNAGNSNRLPGLPSEVSKLISTFNDWSLVDELLERFEKESIKVISIGDDSYPSSLRGLEDSPPILFLKGKDVDSTKPAVSIVGTRRPTSYGKAMTEKIAYDLASAGVTIVSGMARGCDSAAHKGALKAGGYTIAVFGTGIDVCYPKENAKLYDEIVEKGTVLTEFAMGMAPLKHHFPLRNRIVSGLSSALILTEAPFRSGAMMTARFASDQGKDVFALPGSVANDNAQGPHKLIKDGASLIESAKDVLNILDLNLQLFPEKKTKEIINSEHKTIIDLLNTEPLHIDKLAQQCNLKVWRLSTILLEMELKGLVEKQPGNIYSRLFNFERI